MSFDFQESVVELSFKELLEDVLFLVYFCFLEVDAVLENLENPFVKFELAERRCSVELSVGKF